jgi:hypothetical protein
MVSFRHRQTDQHTRATLTQIKFLICFDWLESQEWNICPIDVGGVKPVAWEIILQIILT